MSSVRDPPPDRRLISTRWGRARCPLAAPYALSFATLTAFDTVWVSIEDETGAVGLGEAVALPGYGSETAAGVEQTIRSLLEGPSPTARELRARAEGLLARHPFAASAVLSALDLPSSLDALPTDAAFPLNAALAGDAPPTDLARSLDAHVSRGAAFVKVKVGRDLEAERANARFLLACRPDARFRLAFDANQGYPVDAALEFAAAIAHDPLGRLLWFEQPVDRHDWEGMARVCRGSAVPIVLDECIYGREDLERARAAGAAGVKLKGFKHGGVRAALDLAEQGRALGLTVVFGNGVATDIGNFAEFLVLAAGGDRFAAPGESSGFAKLSRPFVDLGLEVADGYRLRCRLGAAEARERLSAFHRRQA